MSMGSFIFIFFFMFLFFMANAAFYSRIVSKLLFLALRTAGAERCLLVLDEASVLTPKAMVSADSSEVVLFRSDISPPDFPSALLNYVARSHSVVNGSWDTSTVLDSYLDQRRPKSMLCIALSFLSRTVGVLYCEHSQVSGAVSLFRLLTWPA